MNILDTQIAADMITPANLTFAYSCQRASTLLEQGVPDPRVDWYGHFGALTTLASLLADNKNNHTFYVCGWQSREMQEEALESLEIPLPPGVEKEMRKYTDLFSRYAEHLCPALGFDPATYERLGKTLTRVFGKYSSCSTQGTYINPWVGPKERLHKLSCVRDKFAPPHVRTGSWVCFDKGMWLPIEAEEQITCPRERYDLDRGPYYATYRDFVVQFKGEYYVARNWMTEGRRPRIINQTSYSVWLMVEGDLYMEEIREEWTFQGRKGLSAATEHWWEVLKDISFDALPAEWRAGQSRIALPGEDPFTEGDAPAVEEATA